MLFTCANLRNKKCEIKVDLNNDSPKIFLNDEEIMVDKIRFVECSLTKEHVNVVLLLSKEYKKKKELFMEHSWLQHNKKLEDDERVETSNKECCMLFEKLHDFKKISTDDPHFEGRFDGTYDMADIFDSGDFLLCPGTKQIVDLSKVDAVFFERMSSYQKNFDVTLAHKDDSTTSIFTINRKKYFNLLRQMVKGKEIYEGGPDPLPWAIMLKTKKEKNLSWKELSNLYIASNGGDEEDESSDWSEGTDDETDDDAEFDEAIEDVEEEEEVTEEEEEEEEDVTDEEEEEYFTEEDDEYDTSNKRKYDTDSTDENEPKRVKL